MGHESLCMKSSDQLVSHNVFHDALIIDKVPTACVPMEVAHQKKHVTYVSNSCVFCVCCV